MNNKNKRAFIAAPLIGTIIFLVATVFVVGIVNTEAQEVNKATVDAYHNKLASLLELYRLDLYSLFVDGLRQNVEDFLAGIPWINLNSISENDQDARYANCFEMKKAIRAQIVSSGTTYEEICTKKGTLVGCIKGSSPDCVCTGGSGTFLNGLSDLLGALRKDFVFEGITFAPVKFSGYDFDCSTATVGSSSLKGSDLCRKLIPRAEFDCQNFAVNPSSPYQCCSVENSDKECDGPAVKGSIVSTGCDAGDFLLSVNLTDPDVYHYMPRIDATDGAGNQIRSGALGDEALNLQIRYPIFKYRHLSFEFFSYLQYDDYDGSYGTETRKKNANAGYFAGNVKDACNFLKGLRAKTVNDPQYANLTARIWLSSENAFVECIGTEILCCKNDGIKTGDSRCRFDSSHDGFSSVACDPSGLDSFIEVYWGTGSITKRTPLVEFVDGDSRFQVNPSAPNSYKWDAELCYPTDSSTC